MSDSQTLPMIVTDVLPTLDKLATSLSKAQSEFKEATLDKQGNYGRYASLGSIRQASIDALTKHGLSIMQPIRFDGQNFYLDTILLHSSGQSYSSTIRLILDRNNMQGLGSAITYGKRYTMAALLGIVADEDDDGEGASNHVKPPEQNKTKRPQPLREPVRPNSKPNPSSDRAHQDSRPSTGNTPPDFDPNEPMPFDHSEPVGPTSQPSAPAPKEEAKKEIPNKAEELTAIRHKLKNTAEARKFTTFHITMVIKKLTGKANSTQCTKEELEKVGLWIQTHSPDDVGGLKAQSS